MNKMDKQKLDECIGWWRQSIHQIRTMASRSVRMEAFLSLCGQEHQCTIDETRLVKSSRDSLNVILDSAAQRFGRPIATKALNTLLEREIMMEVIERGDDFPLETVVMSSIIQ